MTLTIGDRAFETSTTTGTGTINLAGPVPGFISFVAAVGTGKKVPYTITQSNVSGVITAWETGWGVITAGSPDTLTRNPRRSSNANAVLTLGTGTRNVFLGWVADFTAMRDENLNFLEGFGAIAGTANVLTLTLPVAPLAYSDGMQISGYIATTNTTAGATINVNSLGAKALKINGADPGIGSLPAGYLLQGRYKASTDVIELSSPIIPAIATQGEAEAGTDNTKTMTPLRTKQALAFQAPILNSYIAGFLPSSIAGTNMTASLTVSSGQAVDSTNAAYLLKATTTAWAVSNGNAINGYQGGTTLPNSSTIHFFICSGSSGTGIFAAGSLTPTLPTGYNTYYRRIFSIFTTAAGALVPYTALETEGGSLTAYLSTPVNDYNSGIGTIGTTATGVTLSVPSGLQVQHIGRYWQPYAAISSTALYSPDETDVAPTIAGANGGNGYDLGSNSSFAAVASSTPLITNTSSQIRARSSVAGTVVNITTRGWKDFRR